MPILFTCPHCGLQTNVADQFAGQAGPCARCRQWVTVPGRRSGSRRRAAHRARPSAQIVVIVLVIALVGLVGCGAILAVLLPPAVANARGSRCSDNMRKVGLAMLAYHDVYRSFPPAYLADENGRPMHSWRVLVLPFLGHQSLYEQYDFNEPWDGPNNGRLAASMPPVYACPSGSNLGQGFTSYAAVAGSGTAFDGSKAAAFGDIRDGATKTVVIMEAGGANIPWLKPADLDFVQINLIMRSPGMSGSHRGGVRVLFADASVRVLPATLPPETWQGLLTIRGGEVIPPF